jgi:aminopeptidase N
MKSVFLRVLGLSLLSLVTVTASARPATKNLTRADAARRSQAVSGVRYELSFDLDAKKPAFTGKTTIAFDYKKPAQKSREPLTVDLSGGKITALSVNGAEAAIDHNGYFLTLPAAALHDGANTVAITYQHDYSTDGSGLYRFVDDEDHRVYLYSDFEPYSANELFPSFDQPDLKATYTVTVTAPADWVVVSSARESGTEPRGIDRKRWIFPETAAFSTYVFSLAAGPYKMWSDKAGDIPLRLFARQTLAKYVRPADWFKLTRQGLAFYPEFFGTPYPFKKYDQLLVPDFNSGAMENVAAVTFSERYITRGAPTREDRENLADTLLHEMAHMWFGDLVTMEWWNGLWLNESFATFMATIAQHGATEFKTAWQTFYIGVKQWAYWEDQLVTTHPIEAQVPDTDQAFANFDGITYGKGASVLQQLRFFIGDAAFRRGLAAYFKAHAFGNAALPDFMGAMAKASGKDLKPWSAEWLNTAGLNTVTASYDCRAGKIAGFKLVQTAPTDFPTLRTHKTQVGLYRLGADGAVETAKVLPATYSGESTEVAAADGEACPYLVYPNDGDFDFVKASLDPASVAAAKKSVNRITDPLLRQMVWQSLWDMARSGELPLLEYSQTVLSNLNAEPDIKIARALVETVVGSRDDSESILFFLPRRGAGVDRFLPRYRQEVETKLQSLLAAAEPGSDFQKLWFDAYVKAAATEPAQTKLRSMLAGKELPKGFELDQDRRWDVVRRLNRLGAAHSAELLTAERRRDKSTLGKQEAIVADAVRPEMAVKKKWFAELTQPAGKRPFADQRAAMRLLFPAEQADLQRPFAADYFKALVKVVIKKDTEFQSAFSGSLAPALCADASVKALGAFISANGNLPPVVMKRLKVAKQEDERCVDVRGKVASVLAAGGGS